MYNYTDHLGNIRLRYTSTGLGNGIQKLEENHYYPFGLKHKKYNSYQYVFVALNEIDGYDLGIDPLPESERDEYQYKYNGKEWQDELSLNLYDYGARNYDAALGRWMNIDPLAEKSRRWSPYTYCYNSPLIFVDPDGMLATPPDWYIDNRTGKILGQDGAATNDVRLIDNRDYNEIKEVNGGSTTSVQATAQLQNSEVSIKVTVNDTQIQQELQNVNDSSRKVEHQVYIVLDRNSGEVKAERGTPGTNGTATMEYDQRTADGVTYNTVGGNLLLAQAHGHPLTEKKGEINVPGTSNDDKSAAASSGVNIYSIDAYNTSVGGQAKINRVTPAGVQTNNVGTTQGATGTGTFNMGMDALKRWSGF